MCFVFTANLFPGAPASQRKRLCSYRNLAFWIWSDLRRKERRPLPACVVRKVREKFPPSDEDEQCAEWVFKGFCYADVNLVA